jgi:ATP-dependent RNA helicase RhlE
LRADIDRPCARVARRTRKINTLTTFKDLGLSAPILKALDTEGYVTPTPIQTAAIPAVMAGRDLMGLAQTGTGKTAAFALPILHRLAQQKRPASRRGCRALILSPTRELASQIADSFKAYGRHLGLTVAAVFGGVGYRPQLQALSRGVDILVATPGRLLDHLSERNLSLEATEILVLDEADQMLDLGFVVPIRKIVRQLPAVRQNLFFSATMPKEIGELAAELLADPVRVQVTPAAKPVDSVTQRVIFIESQKKRALLVELFGDAAMSRALIFTRTKRGADRVARHLEGAGIQVAAIHGNKSQGQRERALGDFKASRIRALVATDIAARGIDVDLVTHVVNYEIPNVPESYVHRIGRTARAGAAGIAISLCDGEERAYLKDIERLTRQSIPSEDRRGDAALIAAGRDADREGRPHNGSRHRWSRQVRAERPHAREVDGRDRKNGSAHKAGERGLDNVRFLTEQPHRNSKAAGHRGSGNAYRQGSRNGPGRAYHAGDRQRGHAGRRNDR